MFGKNINELSDKKADLLLTLVNLLKEFHVLLSSLKHIKSLRCILLDDW